MAISTNASWMVALLGWLVGCLVASSRLELHWKHLMPNTVRAYQIVYTSLVMHLCNTCLVKGHSTHIHFHNLHVAHLVIACLCAIVDWLRLQNGLTLLGQVIVHTSQSQTIVIKSAVKLSFFKHWMVIFALWFSIPHHFFSITFRSLCNFFS